MEVANLYKKLSPKDYIDNYEVNKISAEDGLTSIYNIDEGTGYETKDLLTDNVASIDADSTWAQSDVYIVAGSSQVDDETTLVVEDETAEQICGDLRDELAQECSDLTSVLDNMYKTCFDDVAKTGNPDDSMDSALLASKVCSKELNIDEPLQGACNDFPSRNFPDWVGDLCDTHCYHGTFSTDVGCECEEGYYGDTCSDVCPGGPVPPCSGHGTCMSDGTCNCEPNWNGDSICSSCANDYSPPYCDEQQVRPDSSCTRTKCSMNKGGKITRMDCTKKKHDKTGDMVLLEYGTLKVTVRQMTCTTSKGKEFLCIDKIEVEDGVELSFYFKTKTTKKGKQKMRPFINGLKWGKKTKSKTKGPFSIVLMNKKTLKVTHSTTGLDMSISKLKGYFRFDMEVFENVTAGVTGLCQGVVVTPPVVSVDLSATKISGGTVNFGDPDLQDTTNVDGLAAGRTVCFSASTLGINMGQMYKKPNSMTIELYVKTSTDSACHGVIFSYAAKKTFAVWNRGTVVITYDDFTWDTEAVLEDDKWNQISVVWTKKNYKLEVYVFDSDGRINKYATPSSDNPIPRPNPFLARGKLSLGRWQPSRDDTGEHENDAFVGCMDELRIWRRQFQLVEMQGHWDQQIDGNENNLIAYWKFDELSDDDLFLDMVSRSTGFPMAGEPFSTVSLVVSDCPITYESVLVSRRRRDTRRLNRQISHRTKRSVVTYDVSICDSLFSSSSMATTCSSLSSVRDDYYYDCTDAGNDDEIGNAVDGFASECQLLLSLSTYPGKDLCQEYDGIVNLWSTIGDNCDPECNFGTRESSSECICDEGYWGTTCNDICPGGATEPCSGYGTCDQTTGECNCPINRLSSDDCSACSWYGTDCEYSANEADVSFTELPAIAGRLGHIYTLDGLGYTNKEQGEIVLLALASNVIIEGKFVTCYQDYTCLPFIAARIGDDSNGYATITVQTRRAYSSKPRVYINDVETTLDTPAYFNGFTVTRSSLFVVNFEVTDHFSFQIRVEGQYLQLSMVLPSTLIGKTSGFLSGNESTTAEEKIGHLYEADTPSFDICNSTATSQVALGSASATTLTLTAYSQTSTYSSELNMTKFAVSECDSFIYYPTHADKLQSMGGFNLNFDKTSVYSDMSIDTSLYPNITFQMMARQSNNISGGLLFSFTNELAFMVISGDTSIEIHTYIESNETVQESNVTLVAGTWNTLIFSYYSDTGVLEMYRITDGGAIAKKEFTISTWLFNNTGILSFGHWHPPTNGYPYTEPPAFNGELDNFMVWGLAIEGSQTYDLFQMDPALASGSLLYNFQFNEGDGSSTFDAIGYETAILPQYPWVSPEWLPSDLVYTNVNSPDVEYVYFYNNTLQQEAENLCATNLLPGTSTLNFNGITNNTREFYYLNCLQSIAATGDTSAGYNSILELYNIGEVSHGMSNTTSSDLCSQLDTEEFNGTTCTSACQFGFVNATGGCTCAKGYYGTQCDSVCPGDSDNPCSNHGDCDSSGTCVCWWNWQGDALCSSCSSSITGSNCTVLDTSSLSSGSKKVAAVSSNGYYMTFGGQQISFIGETGAFLLFSSSALNIDVHVYQVSCHYGSCIAAVSVSTSSSSVVVTPAGQGYLPKVYQDGIEISLDDTSTVFDASLSISQSSLTEMEITATAIGSIELYVLIQEQFLQVSVLTSSTICQDGDGIFGICGGGAVDYSAMSIEEITADIVANFKLNDSIILTALNSPAGNASEISGYALKFNGTAATSVPLTYSSNMSEDFSVSLYFKPTAVGGYILSYSKDKTFSILNTQPLRIQYDNNYVDTVVTPVVNEWNQIVLTFRTSRNQIDFFHFSASDRVTHQILDFECPSIFTSDGIITLGVWMPSTGSDKYTYNSTFEGLIDDVSIWKDAIETALIYQAHDLNVKLSGFNSAVSTLLTFSEGVGTTAFEVINGNNIELPKSPWQSPEWEISDLPLVQLRTVTSDIYTVTVTADVAAVCSEFFDDAAVSSNCGGIDSGLKEWYHNMCRITASNTGDLSDTTFAMADYSSLCSVTGGTTDPLYTIICALNVTLPTWLSQKCSGCYFGYESNGTCTCYYGYWGTNCDGVCKGGASNPCYGNGVCDISGECQCYGRYNGDECEPSTCQTDWQGTDCTVLDTSYTPLASGAETLVAQVNLIGQLSSFDGIIVDMTERDYFTLMNVSSADIAIHGRFAICETASVLHVCLNGVVFVHNGETYYFSYEGYTGTSVEIETASETLYLYSTLVLGNATLELESPTTVEMTFSHLDLTVRLSSINSRLLLTLSVSNETWEDLMYDIDGVLTSCDTSKAITAAGCSISRSDLCADTSQTIPVGCEMSQSSDALSAYLNNYMYVNSSFQDIIEDKYLAAMESNCLMFNMTGASVSDVTLPDNGFTIELHVKPTGYGGIIMDYVKNGEYFILINTDTGLMVVLDGVYYTTDIILDLDEWNQVALAWRPDVDIMEVYLTDYTGETEVKAVPIPGSVFTTGGTITLGTLTPDLDVAIAMGDFVGYIDEVRIWSRPHTPTIVTQNWRVIVNWDTADVSHSWTFNEGTGLTASESRKGEHFVVDNALNPPKWSKSDLDLSTDEHIKAPIMTTELPITLAELQDAMEECGLLIDAFSLSTGSSSIDDIVAAFEALCVQELTENNDTTQADSILASAAELFQIVNNQSETPLASMCNDVSSLGDYIGYSGDNCTACVFGTVTDNGCECFDSHWGTACENACPIGPLGACNTYGVCNSTAGHCECFSRYQGSGMSAVSYWSSFISSGNVLTNSNYSCEVCADGWLGSDCYFAQATGLSTNTFVGFVHGSYITTLAGISMTLVTPGVYNLLETNTVKIQGLLMPCQGSHLCRYLHEIAFKDAQSVISIQYVEDGNVTVVFDGETLEYPTSQSSSSMSLDWSYMFEYPRIKFGGSSVLVYKSSQGLVSAFKIASSEANSAEGLLGNSDNDWVSDLNCAVDGVTIADEDLMSGSYSGECIRQRYTPSTDEVFIHHDQGTDSLTSGGYMLHLDNHTLTVSHYPIQTDLPKFTLGFWTKAVSNSISKRSTGTYTILKTNTGSNDLEFIYNNGQLEINWDQLHETNKSLPQGTWTYIALTWGDDGAWNVYIVTEDETHLYTGPSQNVGGTISLGNITVEGTPATPIQVDYIQAWSDTKTLEEAVANMQTYSTDYSAGLLMTLALDEGTGSEPTVLTFSSNGTVTSTNATISGANSTTLWQMATIPVTDIYTPTTLRTGDTTNYTQAAIDCLEVLNEGNFSENCGDMGSSLKDHYIESCIRDYDSANPQGSTETTLSNLIFYCQAALEVDECKFTGFLDFCQPTDETEEEANIMIFIFAGAGACLLILIIIIICCWKKKQKKKKKVEGLLVLDADGFTTLSGGAHSNPFMENETSFVDGGRRSVSSIGSGMGSPDVFQSAPPDRFVYKDQKRSLSRSLSTTSRLSGSNSSIDIMVSPTPEPAQIDNRSVTAVSPDSSFARGRVNSTPNFQPTPAELQNVPAPMGTSVMRTRRSMPSISETGGAVPKIPAPPSGRRSSDIRMGAGPKAPWSEEGRAGISPTPTPGNLSVKILWNSLVTSMKENTPTPGPMSPAPLSPGPNLAGAFNEEEDVFTPEPTSEV